MNLPFVKNLRLTWLLPYASNGSKNLSGINIIVQVPRASDIPSNDQQKNRLILLLASLLGNKNYKYNLISLSGNNKEIKTVINIAKEKSESFKKMLIQNFNELKNIFYAEAELKLENTAPRNYHIIGGIFIFQLINKLSERINRHREKTGINQASAFELINISSGEPFNSLSDLEIDLQCHSEDQSLFGGIWDKIAAVAKVYKLSIS